MNNTNNLFNILESREFYNYLSKYSDKMTRKEIIKTSINFIIATRDPSSLIKYLPKKNHETLPYSYFFEKGYEYQEIKKIIYENYIKEGFLFHVTPQNNIDKILNNGLQTLNDYYQCDFYQKCLEVNKVYTQIKIKNRHNKKVLHKNSLFNIPQEDFNSKRCTSVYLSSDLDYILKFYGNTSEFIYLFIWDMILAFRLPCKVEDINPNNIYNYFNIAIKENKINITNEELNIIINFFVLVYNDFYLTKKADKAIILTPISNITSDSIPFQKYYHNYNENISPEEIIDYDYGEIISSSSIPPEDIIIINENEDNTISVTYGTNKKKNKILKKEK